MTTIVIDANVYISALVFGGVPQKAIQLSQRKDWQVCISRPIIDEVAETLAEKFDWTKAELNFALPPLWERCRQVDAANQAHRMCG